MIELTGMKFGSLEVIGRIVIKSGKRRRGYWKCMCVCGNITRALSQSLQTGDIKSCGCIKRVGYKRGKGNLINWLREHSSYTGDECLIYPFGRDWRGYGIFGLNGRGALKAHRWMCESANGPPPSALHGAAHECGNGHLGCVNPRHLSWKTPIENAQDTIRHGRSGRGKRSGRKLDRDKVELLRNPPSGITVLQLSKDLGISYAHATKIRRGDSWREVKKG